MKKEIKKTNTTTLRYLKIMTLLSLLYIFFVCLFMVSHQLFFSRGQLIVFALFGFLLVGRSFYTFEWAPFIFFFLGYELLRGLIPYAVKNVNVFPMIKTDQFIFGFLPTVKLQTLLYHSPNLEWYDYATAALYNFHVFAPIVAGIIFWFKDKDIFEKFALGFLILYYSAFITYILFPAMPPWLASAKGFLPPIQQITTVVASHFLPDSLKLPAIYTIVGTNPVAAIPSLHAAFPLFIFLFVLKKSLKVSLLLIPYVLCVWFSVIYLGEHYFIDVLLGIIYALAVFTIVEKKDFLISLLRFRKI